MERHTIEPIINHKSHQSLIKYQKMNTIIMLCTIAVLNSKYFEQENFTLFSVNLTIFKKYDGKF